MQCGKLAEAWDAFIQCLQISREMNDRYDEANVLCNLCWVCILKRDWVGATKLLTQSQTICRKIEADYLQAEIERLWATLYLETDELDQALGHIDRSIELAVENSDPSDEGQSKRVKGQIHLVREEFDLATEALHTSLRILQKIGETYQIAKTQFALAKLAVAQNDHTQAQQFLDEATATFARLGAEADLVQAQALAEALSSESVIH